MTTLHNIILGAFILVLGITLDAMDLITSGFWSGALKGFGITIIVFSKFIFKKK